LQALCKARIHAFDVPSRSRAAVFPSRFAVDQVFNLTGINE
jgi:hypothetical protein